MDKQLRTYATRSLIMGMVMFMVSFYQMYGYRDNKPMLENWAIITLFAELVIVFSSISLIINNNTK